MYSAHSKTSAIYGIHYCMQYMSTSAHAQNRCLLSMEYMTAMAIFFQNIFLCSFIHLVLLCYFCSVKIKLIMAVAISIIILVMV